MSSNYTAPSENMTGSEHGESCSAHSTKEAYSKPTPPAYPLLDLDEDGKSFRLQHANPLTKFTRANFPKPLMLQKLFGSRKHGSPSRINSAVSSYNHGWSAQAMAGGSQYPPLTPHSCKGKKRAATPASFITPAEVTKDNDSSDKERSLSDDFGTSLAARPSPTWVRMQKMQLRNGQCGNGAHGLGCDHPDTPIPGHSTKARPESSRLASNDGYLSSILESPPQSAQHHGETDNTPTDAKAETKIETKAW